MESNSTLIDLIPSWTRASIIPTGLINSNKSAYTNISNVSLAEPDQMAHCFNTTNEEVQITAAHYDVINHATFQVLLPSFILVWVLLIVGVPGNLLAILVYFSKMKRNTARYFIITLALSDLFNCISSLPIELYLLTKFWTFDFPIVCKFSRFMTACMNNTSSFLLVMIAIERFRSICTPLKPRFTSKGAQIICVTCFVTAIGSASPMLFGYGTQTFDIPVANASCFLSGRTCLIDDAVLHTSYPKYLNMYFFVGHVIVFLILAILYVCIARKIIYNKQFQANKRANMERKLSTFSTTSLTRTSTMTSFYSEKITARNLAVDRHGSMCGHFNGNAKNFTRKHGGQTIRTSRLTCMLFLMTSVFEISFIPYLVLVSMRSEHPDMYSKLGHTGKSVYQLFLRSYMINCAVNPLIYCFYNKNFRRGVMLLFTDCKSSGKSVFNIKTKA